jgi:hypothetical protein
MSSATNIKPILQLPCWPSVHEVVTVPSCELLIDELVPLIVQALPIYRISVDSVNILTEAGITNDIHDKEQILPVVRDFDRRHGSRRTDVEPEIGCRRDKCC